MSASTIVRIIAVRDTRAYEEQGDRFVPIPGSGEARECDRCGRDHEVHVDVELSDGRVACIGQGCARGESMDVVSRIKSSVSAAITRARLAAQLAAARVRHARAIAAWVAVEQQPLPRTVMVERRSDVAVHRGDVELWAFEGYTERPVWAFCAEGGFTAERRQCLINNWRMERYAEHPSTPHGVGGGSLSPWGLADEVGDLERRLVKIERKLGALVAAEPRA